MLETMPVSSIGPKFQQVATTLGIADPAALGALGREGLAKFSHRQLVESSRTLGIHGISRLSKDALAARLWDELERAGAVPLPQVEEVGHLDLDGSAQVLTHKFEVGKHAESAVQEPRDIPWGYEWDRVTGMPVDPERMFVYWEVSDAAVERARKQLGAGGAGAWLNLRVYDTTGRIFDGTNAHGYFDHRVERHDRQWFFHVGKPTSAMFIEVGLKSEEGYFIKVARSARIEFPRREPVAWTEPEWLTVRSSTGPVEHAGRGTPGAGQAGGPHIPNGVGHGQAPGRGFDPASLWQMRLSPWEELVRFADGQTVERLSWEQFFTNGQFEGFHQFSWEGPTTHSTWESGPFSYPVELPEPTREDFVGPVQVYRIDGKTRVVHGPWQVVIRGLGARAGRAVIARWEIHRSWVAEEGHEVKGTTLRAPAVGGSSELMAMGSSDRRWRQGSEARLGGASELWFLGASEVAMRGASERLYAGASEYMMRGSSERQFAGASELQYRGASEQLFKGATENLFRGASERLGGSEQRLGGSEQRPAGAASQPGSPYPKIERNG